MTESEFRDLIKQNISGGFLFYGEEDYLKNYYRRELLKAALADCPPDLQDLNCIRVTLEDGDFSALTTAITTLPMLSEKKVVEVSPPDMGSWRESEKKALLEALEGLKDSPDTVLVLIASRGALDPGTQKKSNSFFRSLSKILTPVEFPGGIPLPDRRPSAPLGGAAFRPGADRFARWRSVHPAGPLSPGYDRLIRGDGEADRLLPG